MVVLVLRWRVVHHLPLDSWIMAGEMPDLAYGTKGMQYEPARKEATVCTQ